MITINGKPWEGQAGCTIAKLMKALNYDFPLMFVRLDGRVVPHKEWDTILLPEEARLEIYPVVAGG